MGVLVSMLPVGQWCVASVIDGTLPEIIAEDTGGGTAPFYPGLKGTLARDTLEDTTTTTMLPHQYSWESSPSPMAVSFMADMVPSFTVASVAWPSTMLHPPLPPWPLHRLQPSSTMPHPPPL
ncbi:hypothetical protein MTO96_022658 [Rhipicephalus appendiculatus]